MTSVLLPGLVSLERPFRQSLSFHKQHMPDRMATICVPVITALCMCFALMAVFIIIVILIVKMIKDKTGESLKKTSRDQHDYADIKPRDADAAAAADCGVYVISDVSQGRESHLLDTAQVQVKGQECVFGDELPGPTRDEANKCTPCENMSEDSQYEKLVQQRPDERDNYMSLSVMSATPQCLDSFNEGYI